MTTAPRQVSEVQMDANARPSGNLLGGGRGKACPRTGRGDSAAERP